VKVLSFFDGQFFSDSSVEYCFHRVDFLIFLYAFQTTEYWVDIRTGLAEQNPIETSFGTCRMYSVVDRIWARRGGISNWNVSSWNPLQQISMTSLTGVRELHVWRRALYSVVWITCFFCFYRGTTDYIFHLRNGKNCASSLVMPCNATKLSQWACEFLYFIFTIFLMMKNIISIVLLL